MSFVIFSTSKRSYGMKETGAVLYQVSRIEPKRHTVEILTASSQFLSPP